MTYRVRVLARARHDLDGFIAFVAERSPEGAARLLARFEDALAGRVLKLLNGRESQPFLE